VNSNYTKSYYACVRVYYVCVRVCYDFTDPTISHTLEIVLQLRTHSLCLSHTHSLCLSHTHALFHSRTRACVMRMCVVMSYHTLYKIVIHIRCNRITHCIGSQMNKITKFVFLMLLYTHCVSAATCVCVRETDNVCV